MAVISKFGQYVLLQVHSLKGGLVFETDSLKVDFNVMHIPGFSRGRVNITNLAPATIRALCNSDVGNFVTISTALHDSELKVVMNKMYVSNAIEETKVPESITSLFCYSALRKIYMERHVDVDVARPSIRELVANPLVAAGYDGNIQFKHFPPEILDHVPPRGSSRQEGSVSSILDNLGQQYDFNTYTDDNNLVMLYKPDYKNVGSTQLYSGAGDIKLATSNMRSNPVIGPAVLHANSNLDVNLKPGSVVDISELLTVGTNTDEITLQLAEDYLKEKVAGFTKYQVRSTQHIGTNWGPEWNTKIIANSPTPGISMSTNKWWL